MISASEIQKKRLTPEEIHLIVSSSGIVTIQPFLEEILRESRNRDISPIKLFELQGKIAEKMILWEKQITAFKHTADREKQNDEWYSREIYKAHRRMLKMVMDGIAFRFLNFERPVLRQLSQHNQTGFLTDGFLKELEKAAYIVNKTGFYVILNDLTNFLKYGDLTIVSPQGNIIDEVKTTGKAKGSQKQHLDEIIDMLNQKVFKMGNQSAQYITIPGRPTSFLTRVEQIINKSLENEGIYAERVSPYLWVSSTYTPRLMEYFKKTGKFPRKPEIPFSKNEISAPTNSLMFFEEFSPNIMPYSVFPFSEKVISEIMTGQIQLKMVLSEKDLKKTFSGKGWELTMPSREDILSVYDSDDLEKIKEAIWNPVFHSKLRKGAFSYQLPREVLLRIETEFRSARAIIDESEGLMKATSDRIPRMVTTNFSEEFAIWR